MKKTLIFLIVFIGALMVMVLGVFLIKQHRQSYRLLWFIPDGVRGDWVFQLAEEGRLPNIKKMMDNGASAYSVPTFPSHTPVNFATLRTGCYPEIHGISDGPIRLPGSLLTKPLMGFSSSATHTPAIWDILEKNGQQTIVFSVPGSSPPTMKKGITIKGRWSGWGIDTPPLLFTTEKTTYHTTSMTGFILTRNIESSATAGWEKTPPHFDALPREIKLPAHGSNFYGYVFDSVDDKTPNYDSIAFCQDKKVILTVLRKGKWSDWIPVTLHQKKGDDIATHVKIKIITLSENAKDIRIRFFFNSLNRSVVEPPRVYDELMSNEAAGPAMDYVDDWPPQLVTDADYETFREEAYMSVEWHKRAASYLLDKYKSYSLIQTIYTTNQFLESPFWMGHIDPTNKRVFRAAEKEKYWNEIVHLYQQMDDIVGEYLKHADKNTIVVFSSDHGMASLHRAVMLNNLFANKGWLKYTIDAETGRPQIDWKNTKVIYEKLFIYVNPQGFGKNGLWERASGVQYESLRDEVIKALYALKDTDGSKPTYFAKKWEEAPSLHLPKDRVGDIIIAVKPGYAWSDKITTDQTIFAESFNMGGHKQTVSPTEKVIWAPFVIMGPGVKKGIKINNINHVDQMPTLLHLMGIGIPHYVQGRVLSEIFEDKKKE